MAYYYILFCEHGSMLKKNNLTNLKAKVIKILYEQDNYVKLCNIMMSDCQKDEYRISANRFRP